jgi:hypothetical protein
MAETAIDIIRREFKFLGLESLLPAVETGFRDQSLSPNDGPDTIGLKLAETPEFKKRFPANEILKQQGKQQFRVTDYVRLESSYRNTLQSRSMPPGFYDSPEDFSNFIAGDVSPDELGARIDQGYQAVRNAPANVVNEFKRLYGVSEGDLAAYFIDPERARPTFDRYEAERQARAASISAQAQQQAQIEIDRQQAEALARAGITGEQAQAGFAAIGDQQGLFAPQMAGEQQISQAEQIGAAFGTNAEARRAIARRRRTRQAAFEAGGGVTETQGGVVGLRTVGQ